MTAPEEEQTNHGLNKNATRMLTGFIMGTIAMSAIIYGKWAILLMLLVIIFFASKEYVKILEHKGFLPEFEGHVPFTVDYCKYCVLPKV